MQGSAEAQHSRGACQCLFVGLQAGRSAQDAPPLPGGCTRTRLAGASRTHRNGSSGSGLSCGCHQIHRRLNNHSLGCFTIAVVGD